LLGTLTGVVFFTQQQQLIPLHHLAIRIAQSTGYFLWMS
jgi:hypothetical protein